MNSPTPAAVSPAQPGASRAFGKIKLLVGGYLAISVLAVVAIVVMHNDAAQVNSSVWIHGILVAASAFLMLAITRRAARGVRSAFVRLRIASAVLVVAIAVIIALPGSFPLWMKAEQGVGGLLMLGVVVLANGRNVRSLFAAKPTA